MQEAGWVDAGEDLKTNEPGSQTLGTFEVHVGEGGGMTELATIPQDCERLRQAQSLRIKTAYPEGDVSGQALGAPGQEFVWFDLCDIYVFDHRPQQLGYIQGVAPACPRERLAQLIARLGP
jgi:hypothetical protein